MNIRAKILGGASSSDESILPSKRRKGASAQALDSLIEREEARTNHSRSEDRHRLLDETVSFKRNGAVCTVELINVSGGGAMIGGDIELMLWDRLELQLGENGTVECVVRWLRNGRYGLEFAHETRIDCGADEQANILREVIRRSFPDLEFEAELEPETRHSGAEGRGERRHPLVWSGTLHHDYQSTRIRIRNISATGAMIECSAMLTVGSEPLLELGDELSIPAKVAWVLGDEAGLRFDRPFDLHDLARARPQVTPEHWNPPSYLTGEPDRDSPWAEHWRRMSVGELRQELEGFMKR
jgi:PilZ domain-containing protein